MASWTSRGGYSRISTVVTFTPTVWVTSSSFVRRDLVDLLALGEHVVKEDVADNGAERRSRDARDGGPEVLDLEDGSRRLLLITSGRSGSRSRWAALSYRMQVCCGISTRLTEVDVDAPPGSVAGEEHQARPAISDTSGRHHHERWYWRHRCG